MNPNVWNVKDILSIPTASSRTRIASSNAATSGYSSLSDSQYGFGSQFWPENSQGMSQEMSFTSRNSQQSSQEGNEQKISSNYHTKPFLFGGEGKDKGIKPLGLLEKFEEDKKKAKEKNESDMLFKVSLSFREMLNNIQHSIFGTEKAVAVCKTILEGFDKFAVTVQQSQSSLCDGVSHNFETMLKELISQKQMLSNIEGKLLETGLATRELGSYVHGLEKGLEALKQDHVRGNHHLEEAVQLLSTLVSNHSARKSCGGVADSAIQTSPGLGQPSLKVQPDSLPEGTGPLCCQPESTQPSDVSSWNLRSTAGPRKPPRRAPRRRPLRRPLGIPKGRKRTIWDENSQPPVNSIKEETLSPLKKICKEAATARCQGVPVFHPNGGGRSNKGLKAFVAPFSPFSEDSSSSVCVAGNEITLKPAEPEGEMPEKGRGLWQLFDMHCESDFIILEE
ncbi:unnamed protein product [Arctogadus glacialis]